MASRSLELVVAILGVVKAGGCYLPLEMSHPPARLSLMLADAGAALVVTTQALAERLPAGLASIPLDAAAEQHFESIRFSRDRNHNRPTGVQPESERSG